MADLYLVQFKGTRRGYFYNSYYHNLTLRELVVVQAERGEDIGELRAKLEREPEFDDREQPRSILRPATDEDREAYVRKGEKEEQYRVEIIEIIAGHRLNMKVVDVDCQFDGNKLTVYFTADRRVDFRALVKDLAARYRTRIELRQIGVRDEARRLDGLGICGLRQCCNTWINEFAPVSTAHARLQELPLNPAKISGNCGRLLCCLRYEADTYKRCKKLFPDPGTRVETSRGDGIIERVDVFNEEAVIRGEDNVFFRCPAKEFNPEPEPAEVPEEAEVVDDQTDEVEAPPSAEWDDDENGAPSETVEPGDAVEPDEAEELDETTVSDEVDYSDDADEPDEERDKSAGEE